MENLLEMLGLKKSGNPLLKPTTLTESNLVALNREYNVVSLIKGNSFYHIKESPQKMNSSNPKISPKYNGTCTKRVLKGFEPHKRLRNF